jgi:aminoglycoside 6'-N-acetyltransferase
VDADAFAWRRVTIDDFPLLQRWLRRSHVARWWHHETSDAAVARDFGPTVRGEELNEDLVVMLDGRPVGLVQRCRLADYPDYRDEIAQAVPVPDGAFTIDYLIGEADLIGKGLGTRMLIVAIARVWLDHPDASCIIVPVNAANIASWRALEKAGLRRVGAGELEPDNPADDPLHYFYRIDRPR